MRLSNHQQDKPLREKKLKIIFAVLLIFATGTGIASEIDKRQAVQLTELQRNHVLTEMRALLSGIQKILEAILREDMAGIAQHSRSLGMGMAHKGEDHLKTVLPKEFMQLGMAVHRGFDQMAVDAESRKDPQHTLRQLSELMKKCVACHESYQIRVMGQSDHWGTSSTDHHH
jgi:cytochrome c556